MCESKIISNNIYKWTNFNNNGHSTTKLRRVWIILNKECMPASGWNLTPPVWFYPYKGLNAGIQNRFSLSAESGYHQTLYRYRGSSHNPKEYLKRHFTCRNQWLLHTSKWELQSALSNTIVITEVFDGA